MPWIGNTVLAEWNSITASIQEKRFAELREILNDLNNVNVIPVKTARSLAGKCNGIASLLFAWKLFLAELWVLVAQQAV